jgi:plasmid stabilization system protein ParE
MQKKWNVLWTEKSVDDLLAIKYFISQDSIVCAEEWIEELYSAGISLANFPTRGRIVPEFNQENLRELLIENYRLVYRVKKR